LLAVPGTTKLETRDVTVAIPRASRAVSTTMRTGLRLDPRCREPNGLRVFNSSRVNSLARIHRFTLSELVAR